MRKKRWPQRLMLTLGATALLVAPGIPGDNRRLATRAAAIIRPPVEVVRVTYNASGFEPVETTGDAGRIRTIVIVADSAQNTNTANPTFTLRNLSGQEVFSGSFQRQPARRV